MGKYDHLSKEELIQRIERLEADLEKATLTPSASDNEHVKETIRGFKAILDGEMDEYPEQAFLMVGTIDDVKEKAKEVM